MHKKEKKNTVKTIYDIQISIDIIKLSIFLKIYLEKSKFGKEINSIRDFLRRLNIGFGIV